MSAGPTSRLPRLVLFTPFVAECWTGWPCSTSPPGNAGRGCARTTPDAHGARRKVPPRPGLAERMDQNAPVPLGVPRPDGPSQPTRAVHHCVVGQVPLLPLVTSNSDELWAYG
jgi:hypothetical protein